MAGQVGGSLKLTLVTWSRHETENLSATYLRVNTLILVPSSFTTKIGC